MADGSRVLPAVFAAVCFALGSALWFGGVFDEFDRKFLDQAFAVQRAHFPQPVYNDPVLVGIDEAFLRQVPEPMALLHGQLAELFTALAAAKPRAVGLDIVLPEKSFSFLKPEGRPDFDYDRELARGLLRLGAAAPVVIGETWDHSNGRFHEIHPAFVAASSQWVLRRGPAGFRPLGSALVCPDADGRVREYPGIDCQPGGTRATLSSRLVELLDRAQTWSGFIHYGIGPEFSYIPGRELIAWQQAGDQARLAQLRDRVVLVGTVFDNEDRFVAPVPLAGWEPQNHRLPGLTIQAQIVRSMLNQGLLQPAAAPFVLGLILLAATFAFAGRFTLKLLVFAGFVLALFAVALLMLRATIFLPPSAIVFTAFAALAASGLFAAYGNWRERRHLSRTFAGYVSPRVLDGILSGELAQGRAAEKRHLCVLFSDIHGFTAISERLPPDGVMALLNLYFDRMASIVHQHGGMVDKFIGDGMMAIFGAPQALVAAEKNALEAAHAMLLALPGLNAEFAARGLPGIAIRVGLHAGDAVIGHVGSRERHEYTAIGDTVNVAARLCGLPESVGYPVLCSQPVAAAVGMPEFFADLGLQPLKGHSKVRVFGWRPPGCEASHA